MGRALRILLAEDNPGDVYLIKEALNRHSPEHELLVATDGGSAWKLIEAAEKPRARKFDIFMLDLNLPTRPGLELLARVRSSRGRMSRALIVIVTSSNAAQDRSAAAQGGADYFFCKPSNLDAFLQLGAIVRRLWAERTRRRGTSTASRTAGGRDGRS